MILGNYIFISSYESVESDSYQNPMNQFPNVHSLLTNGSVFSNLYRDPSMCIIVKEALLIFLHSSKVVCYELAVIIYIGIGKFSRLNEMVFWLLILTRTYAFYRINIC